MQLPLHATLASTTSFAPAPTPTSASWRLRPMQVLSRLAMMGALTSSLLPLAACPEAVADGITLPGGLSLGDLPEGQQRLLRVTLAIDDGVLAETDLSLDDTLKATGSITLNNADDAEHRSVLAVYGRFAAGAEEVLLGQAEKLVTVASSGATRLDFDDVDFESCGGADDVCDIVFDRNRNGHRNIEDLLPVAAGGLGVDPAPQAPFLDINPDSLQFPSGIRLGTFARQIVVVENSGPNPVRIDNLAISGGQGFAVSLFDPILGAAGRPRRALAEEDLGFVVAPGAEEFVAVSFAPVNAFVTTAALQVVATDTVTGVAQGGTVKLLANVDGDLRPADRDYTAPDLDDDVNVGGATLPVEPFPAQALFSGQSVFAFDDDATPGLPKTGATIRLQDGADVFAMPADGAFSFFVRPGERFAASLGGLSDDMDLALVAADIDDVAGTARVVGSSRQAGTSAESIEFLNDGDDDQLLLLVMGRIDADIQGPRLLGDGGLGQQNQGLAADVRAPFALSCTLTKGPEFADVDAVVPARGPLEGGITVTLRGRGFQAGAAVTFAELPALDVVIVRDVDGNDTITLTLPPGSLEAGRNPAVLVVENPSPERGGDGQAATLPDGFLYDPPAPRLTSVSPDVAPTTGSNDPVEISGAFFSNRFGAPHVFFGTSEVESSFVASDTLQAIVPARGPGSVLVTVRNVLDDDGTLGAASPGRSFTFVTPIGPPPQVQSVAPNTGAAEGGQVVALSGTGFGPLARVFFAGREAVVNREASSSTTLTVTTAEFPGDGAADVRVVNSDGQAGSLAAAFTATFAPPAISQLTPNIAVDSGGTPIIVVGVGFRTGITAEFVRDATRSPATAISRLSATSLLVTSPPFTVGSANLVVRNPDGQTAQGTLTFVTPSGPAPTISFLDPSSGSLSGGDVVSIFGANFENPRVFFADSEIAAENINFIAGDDGRLDELEVEVPAGSALGTVAVRLINDDGQSAATAYTYVEDRNPRVSFVDPGRVHTRGNDLVYLLGENLDLLGAGVTATSTVAGATQEAVVRSRSATLIIVQLRDITITTNTAAVLITLTGAGRTVSTSAGSLTVARPLVSQVELEGSSGQATTVDVFGSNLNGERLSAVAVSGTDPGSGAPFNFQCPLESTTDSGARCQLSASDSGSLSSPPARMNVHLTYTNAFGASSAAEVSADVPTLNTSR